MDNFFEGKSEDARFLQICHSQGAIHVRNALLDYPHEIRDRIFVVAIAPGAYIHDRTCARVIHYVSRDVIPDLDWEGAKKSRHTTVKLDPDAEASFFDHTILSPTYRRPIKNHITEFFRSGVRIYEDILLHIYIFCLCWGMQCAMNEKIKSLCKVKMLYI